MKKFIRIKVLSLLALLSVSAFAQVPQAEKDALIALYNSTGGANWTKRTGWDVTNPSSVVTSWNATTQTGWYGVTVTNGRVSTIALGNNKLVGPLPTQIGDFGMLKVLHLHGNELSGSIPDQIGNLPALTTLYLFTNKLTGTIPATLGNVSTLSDLRLYTNQLAGEIPSQLGNLPNLQYLMLNVNKLTGSIPASLGNLSKLTSLYLDSNQLTGSIPTSFVNLNKLLLLKLNVNKLSGSIPLIFGNMPLLQELNLCTNELTGDIPTQIGQLPALRYLRLYGNKLTGSIPAEVGQLSNLLQLELQGNQLSGSIPPQLGNATKLTYIDFGGNSFSGVIPTEFGQLTDLVTVYLSSNKLEGSIPNSFQNLTKLKTLFLPSNKLSGSIPNLTGLTLLKDFRIQGNKFRFVDFVNQYSTYKTNMTTFAYSPMALTDEIETVSGHAGSTVTLTMCTDGRYDAGDTFQWRKNNVAIANATARQLVISNLSAANAAVYTCVSTHPSNPDITGLTLQRNTITLSLENCSAPTGLTATSITTNSAQLSWYNPGGVTEWEVKLSMYSTSGNHIPVGTYTTTTPSYLATGLNPMVFYVYTVRAKCTACACYSNPSEEKLFRTKTADFSCPEGFAWPVPDPDWASFRTNPSANVYHDIIATPAIPIPDNAQFRFWAFQNVYQIRIASATNPANQNNEAAYTTLLYQGTNGAPSTGHETVIDIPAAFWGQSIYISLIDEYTHTTANPHQSYQEIGRWFDDVRVVEKCLDPTDLEATNIDCTMATLNWQSASSATTFQIENILATATPTGTPTATVNGTSYQQTGLTDGVQYKFYVRAICESCLENNSGWSGPYSYTAACPVISCTVNNPNTTIVKQKLIALVNHLNTLPSVPDGYTCDELNGPNGLAPFITDSNPAIYNFSTYDPTTSQEGAMRFSFNGHGNEMEDVTIWVYGNRTITDINLVDYSNSDTPVGFSTLYNDSFTLGAGKTFLTHINFCPESISCTVTNANAAVIENLVLDLLHHLLQRKINNATDAQIEGTNPAELVALAPYISDPAPRIYNFHSTYNEEDELEAIRFSFSSAHEDDVVLSGNNFSNISSSNIHLNLQSYASISTGIDLNDYNYGEFSLNLQLKHLDFCPEELISCTSTNSNSQVVESLTVNLIEHLIQRKLSNATDADIEGSLPAQLMQLSPYVTDVDPKIYNFHSTYTVNNVLSGIRFSFSADHENDIVVEGGNFLGINSSNFHINLGGYLSATTGLSFTDYQNGGFLIKNFKIKHINFCPQTTYCTSRVTLVVDESGSIDETEARKIRKQLNLFVEQQAAINQSTGSHNYISIVGMSDSDLNLRQDHVTPRRVTNANLQVFKNWINRYGLRYGGLGISQSSDYWKSGLTKALTYNPEVVIMITDGCQTADATALKATMQGFDNYRATPFTNTALNPNAPHLYVVGIDNGFYVDSDSPSGKMARSSDPNFDPTLQNSAETSRVTSFLARSLQYLFNYPITDFPAADVDNFHADYFGHNDFGLLASEEVYFSEKLSAGENKFICVGIDADNCDDCFSFQPQPGYDYMLSAWVKEDSNIQLKTYEKAKIQLVFYNDKKALPGSIITPTLDAFGPSGDIIEGWQRIVAKFNIPEGTIVMGIELVNEGNGTPVYFDDIRVHPLKGSMKSFVYDPETFKLMSELDENNYSTFYEYDNAGGLVRIKKETAKGVKTIQETRSGNVITPIEE